MRLKLDPFFWLVVLLLLAACTSTATLRGRMLA